jgi:O-antigen ligase
VPIYNVLILSCLLISLPAVTDQLKPSTLAANPITVCVVGLLVAVVVSHLARSSIHDARTTGLEFGKAVLYYLLVVGLIDSPSRLRKLLMCQVAFTTVLTSLALLQYHGIADVVPATVMAQDRDLDEETGEMVVSPRLRSTGIYNDPNDLSLILTFAVLCSIYFLGDRSIGSARVLLTGPMALFIYSITLTQSRGGFMALLAGLTLLLGLRLGWRKTIPLLVLLLPFIAVLFSGRQTAISTGVETAQERIQLWRDGFMYFRQSPVFGMGQGQFVEETGLVAHNSFFHCFIELGFFGGVPFIGGFFCAIWFLVRAGRWWERDLPPDLQAVRPYLAAIVGSYAVGMLTLSRSYVAPTYLILGLASAFLRIASRAQQTQAPSLTLGLVGRMAAVGTAFLVATYVFVRISAN